MSLTVATMPSLKLVFAFSKNSVADHIPKECLDPYPELLAWMGRVEGHPKVAAYKASKGK
jgi:glutathione S-transferase